MENKHLLASLRENRSWYLAGAVLILGTKYLFGQADSDSLDWILSPTVWWTGILGGISFERMPGAGYVNHFLRFLIAPSCAGIRFLILSFAMLFFSFLHRMVGNGRKLAWTLLSLALSFFTTVFTNGIRIVLSIYLPPLLLPAAGDTGWLFPERLHTLIGVVTYFTALCILSGLTDPLSARLACGSGKDLPAMGKISLGRVFLPAFWYLFFLLGIPLLTGAWRNDGRGFGEYALLLLIICPILLFLSYIGISFLKRLGKTRPGG